jgi:hypothetical protein
MKKGFSFVILAITKTYDKFCIAGMDEKGKWLRPLPVGKEKFWYSVKYANDGLIQVGDLWEITEYETEYDDCSPGHTEDLRLIEDPTFERHLTNEELIRFVQKFQEDEVALNRTLNAESRSLCLVEADNFNNFLHESSFSGKMQARITFSFGEKQYNNTTSTPGFPITDLKWRAYTIQQIPTTKDWSSLFICVGLARPEPKKGLEREYPMIISVITDPEVPLLRSYPS